MLTGSGDFDQGSAGIPNAGEFNQFLVEIDIGAFQIPLLQRAETMDSRIARFRRTRSSCFPEQIAIDHLQPGGVWESA